MKTAEEPNGEIFKSFDKNLVADAFHPRIQCAGVAGEQSENYGLRTEKKYKEVEQLQLGLVDSAVSDNTARVLRTYDL